jgi:hypothetical protein
MLYKSVVAVALVQSVAANTAEVSTTNLRSGAAFDNLKASWSKALNIGDFKSKLSCGYDYNANRDFLNEVSLTGDLVEGKGDDMSVSYEVTYDCKSKNTDVQLTAVQGGTTLRADYSTDEQLKEVGAARQVDVGDQKVDVEPSWLVKAKTARVKLMSAMNGGDKLSAQIDYATEGGDTSYEVGYEHNLEAGRDVSATFRPGAKELDVELVDNKFENGATWTAKAEVPLDGGNAVENAKLSLRRSWNW